MCQDEGLAPACAADEDGSCASLVVKLAYDGSAYSGFAKQKDPRLHTVQGELEQALATLFARPVETVCAGRTDAGVHALGQVVSCVLERSVLQQRDAGAIVASLNALTPDDIAVKGVGFADADFSARFDAVSRQYRYRIVTGRMQPLFLRGYAWWHRGALDIEAMREGARFLVGEHDFASFCKAASAEGKNTVRCLQRLAIEHDEQLGEEHIVVTVEGNAFLHTMVRTIVGTLADVGTGRREAAWVRDVLQARERSAAGQSAPAHGLTFYSVVYEQGRIRPQL